MKYVLGIVLFLIGLLIVTNLAMSKSTNSDFEFVLPTQIPTDSLPTDTPTPTLVQCNLSDKTVYTQTQQDCDSLQSQENSPRMLPPCAMFAPVAYVPCSQIP